jgi:hypothetical protein
MKIFETTTYHKFKNLVPKDPNRYNRALDSTTDEYFKFEEIKNKLKFLNQNIARAANRGENSQFINVGLDYLFETGEKQKWKCSLTGAPLEFVRGGTNWLGKWCNPNSCTIDRIDSSKGYVQGNIQLITWKANCLKQHLDNDEFIEFCKEVALWDKKIPK